jgi:hypothetical protein
MSAPDDPFPDDLPLDEDYDPHPLPTYSPVWSGEMSPAPAEVPWLWHGYLAPSNITLLTSRWKTGKTTLLSVLLARRAAGGTLAGRALKPGRTAVVCEEGEWHWQQRRRTLDFGNDVAFFCQPFERGRPTLRQWEGLMNSIALLDGDRAVDLAVIDPLAPFLPGRNENSAEVMLRALMPLDHLLSAGIAVLLLHHPRKGQPLDGQAARGSGALLGHVDITIEMWPYPGAGEADRRRVLRAGSRYAATPRQLVIEWNADGTDYLARGTLADEEFREEWLQLAPYFASAPAKLTRRELRTLLPTGRGSPSDRTVWRLLERAVAEGVLLREGTGHRDEPFRYWLPQREAEWMKDPLYVLQKLDQAALANLQRLAQQPPPGVEARPRKRARRAGVEEQA